MVAVDQDRAQVSGCSTGQLVTKGSVTSRLNGFFNTSLKPMDEVISLDPAKRTVTVAAGITYGRLFPYLDGKGFALHSLASFL